MKEDDARLIAACTEALQRLASGGSPQAISTENADLSEETVRLCDAVSQLVIGYGEMQTFMREISAGNLAGNAPVRNQIFAPLKELQANLRHLVWQTRQIADGDLSQNVDFLGEFSVSFNSMIDSLREKRRAEAEIISLNSRLGDAVAQLQAANRELEAFSYSVSHDLRSPLRHISGFATLLLKKVESLPADDKVHRYASSIVSATETMQLLIERLLDFSRLGRKEMERVKVDLGGLVAGVLEELQWQVDGRSIEWRIGRLPDTHGDPMLLGLVFTNLIGNAVKFTRQRATAVIEIGCREENGETVFFVKDNGAGFNMSSAERLFSLFQRLHRQSDFEGTGVGLANVRRIIARHGGRTWAEGAMDQGATFYFTLPGVTGADSLS